MKLSAPGFGLGLALLAAGALPTNAADWAVGSGGVIKDFGSVKDYRNAAVPVPAPNPSYDYSKDWYIRGDIGWTVGTSMDVTTNYGLTVQDDPSGFAFGSVGFGRYLTPSIRAEMSFDFRPKKTITKGTSTFKGDRTEGPTDNDLKHPAMNIYHLNVNQTDNSSASDQTAFLSLYYDFNKGGRFQPYVGGGLGLDWRRFKRTTSQTDTCVTYDTIDLVDSTASKYGQNCTGTTFLGKASDNYASALGVAAAFMIGVGYEMSPGVTWDTGYRAVWQGAEVQLGADSVTDNKVLVKLSDRLDHEIRTGVRIDLQ